MSIDEHLRRLRLGHVRPAHLASMAYRHQSPGRDPLSGEGARGRGGRYNPPASFPVLYLALSEATAAHELERLGRRHALGLAALLPRELYKYELDLDDVLDLRELPTLAALGITRRELVSDALECTQELGSQAHALGFKAVVAPSAAGAGDIVAVLVDNAHPLDMRPVLAATWTSEEMLLETLAA